MLMNLSDSPPATIIRATYPTLSYAIKDITGAFLMVSFVLARAAHNHIVTGMYYVTDLPPG